MPTDQPTTHETKATRMMVIYRLRAEGRLEGVSDAALGQALDVDRITIWKDKRALAAADRLYNKIMGNAPWEDHCTVTEAAEQLRCSEETVRMMARDGLIRGAKTYNQRWRLPKAEIKRLSRQE